jgi:hypothetical protein
VREPVHEQRQEILHLRPGEALERLGHEALDGLGRERAGELLGQAIEPAFAMPSRGQIDVEFGQSGCHGTAPPASPVRVLADRTH